MTEAEKTAKQIKDISDELKEMDKPGFACVKVKDEVIVTAVAPKTNNRDMATMIAHTIRMLTKDDTEALKTLALIMEQVAFAPSSKMETVK